MRGRGRGRNNREGGERRERGERGERGERDGREKAKHCEREAKFRYIKISKDIQNKYQLMFIELWMSKNVGKEEEREGKEKGKRGGREKREKIAEVYLKNLYSNFQIRTM